MVKQNRTILKGYFETGDTPSQAQYADLIDSDLNLSDSGLQIIKGQISSSHVYASKDIVATGSLTTTNVTASGNISGSLTSTFTIGGLATVGTINTGQGATEVHLMNQHVRTTDNVQFANITSSANISASNTSTGSFGSMVLSNLPSSKPTLTGSLWLSGSAGNGSKYLVVFTG